MKTYFMQLCLIPVLTLLLTAHTALAASFDHDEGMSKAQLVESLSKNTSLNSEQIENLILTLQKQFALKPDQKLPIKGYLYAAGLNGALLMDHDTWLFDANIQVPGSSELVHIPKMFLCDFHNGGLKFEVAYKWMFTFIPNGVNVDELHGAIYGRGLGLVAEAFLGLEGSWMPAQNRAHDLFHVAIKLGFGGGILIPKMEFKLREIK
ncbi:hypothetical protein [Bdellovibrio svalbardensis]|uniref:DUF3575 domain-containing protein n=1 Tax=Bdellovibrio svalbardensis TaxID=2972972 RepID=A0ABT6DLD1_9BACT|nr:hypothetical protein [Bdellovibrio svalbardensis]MDG0817691.1 hypothetical protein [Bdellovibrio svalbardensis]